jgi:DNA mismatch endonuclease (patch repair protein)
MARFKTVILVHGCFWHGHGCSPKNRRPKSNTEYWNGKIDRNIRRDVENSRRLSELGWRTIVIWACELGDTTALETKLQAELSLP